MKDSLRLPTLAALCLFSAITPAVAEDGGAFESFLASMQAEATRAHIAPHVAQKILAQAKFLPRVIALDQAQPEGTLSFDDYVSTRLTQTRIEDGQRLMRRYSGTLHKMELRYGVPAEVIVALMGVETSYGKVTGNTDIISALATLAYEGRRADYFKQELLNAMRVVQRGIVKSEDYTGSWAGAYGFCQFMPTSILNYAQDGNGDSKINLKSDLADVFASIANYLHKEGWNRTYGWGHSVFVPQGLQAMPRETAMPMQQWHNLGLHIASQEAKITGQLVQTGTGRGLLVTDNFSVLRHWNKSDKFAGLVGLLADELKKAKPTGVKP